MRGSSNPSTARMMSRYDDFQPEMPCEPSFACDKEIGNEIGFGRVRIKKRKIFGAYLILMGTVNQPEDTTYNLW